jgi:dTMP kinase
MTGCFIVIEGLDGSGKSTQIRRLAKFLRNKGISVLETFEPTQKEIGQEIRSVLRGKKHMDAKALQMLFVKDRDQHLRDEVEPAIVEGNVVLCDRYFFSTIAFGSLEVDIDFLKDINSSFRIPDLTIFIDVIPEECIKRIEKRGTAKEHFEKQEKMEKIRSTYLSLSDYPNFHVVDGMRSKEDIFEDVRKLVEGIV